MQVAATDFTIAAILEPIEAQALLELMAGRVIAPELIELEAQLDLFVNGPDLPLDTRRP